MGIKKIETELTGQSGLLPRFIYIDTNDTILQITQPEYLEGIIRTGIQFNEDMMALVTYFTPGPISVRRVALFDVDLVNGKWLLVEYDPTGGASGNVGPGTINKVALFTSGSQVQDSGITQNTTEFTIDRPLQMYTATSDPSSTLEGSFFWKSDTDELKVFDGATYITIGGAGSDTKEVKVTINDTTPGFLDDKLVISGSEILKTLLNPAANEQLQMSINVGVVAGSVAAGDDSRFPTLDQKDALIGTGIPSAANVYVTNDDPRLTDSRLPSGPASGDLSGFFPGPIVSALTTILGPTSLTIGSISDGQVLKRSGTAIIGVASVSPDELVKISAADTTSGYLDSKLVVSGSEIVKTILNPAADEDLQLSINVGTVAGSVAAGNDSRIPTQDENDALQGTDGVPSGVNRYVTDSDSRMTNSRPPSGVASGDLSGSYPGPSVSAITTTLGPTSLAIGSVADGLLLQRSGSTIIGVAASTGDVVGPASSTDNALARFDLATGKLIQNSVAILTDTGDLSGLGAVTGTSFNGVFLTTAGAATNFLNEQGNYVTPPSGTDELVKVVATDTTPGYLDDKLTVLGTEISKTVVNPLGDSDLQFSINVGTTSGSVASGADARFPTTDEKAALVGTGIPSAANVYVTNDDSRLSDARVPTGLAGSDVTGSYPSSLIVSAITTPLGPTSLSIGSIADGQSLQRSGSTIVGYTPVDSDQFVKVIATDTTPGYLDDKLTILGTEIVKTVITPLGDSDLQLSVNVGTTSGSVAAGDDSRIPTQDENDALQGTNGVPSSVNRYVTDSDPRNTDSRAPSGAASGDLSGTYPAPSVAAITTTSGPTSLTIGSIADGESLQRSGTSIIGYTPVDVDEKVKISGADTTPGFLNDKLILSGTELTKTIINPAADEDLQLGVNIGTSAGSLAAGDDSRFPTSDEKAALVGTGTPSAANVYVTNDDPRLTDARTPTGAASGQLGGTYPSPDVRGLRETGGPTLLTMGSVPDTYLLSRSGSDIVGVAPSTFTHVFGNDYQNVTLAGPFTSSSLTYIDVVSLITPVLTGTYRLTLSWAFGNTSKIQYLQIYDNGLAQIVGQESIVKINQNTNIWYISRSHLVTISGVSKTYKIQIKTENAPDPVDVRDILFEIWRVA